MTPAFDFCRIVVENGPAATPGYQYATWLQFEVSTSIFSPGTFSFRAALTGGASGRLDLARIKLLRNNTREDTVVRIERGRDGIYTPLFRGIIGRQFIGGDASGEYIDITGRDGGQLLQDNEASPRIRVSGKTLPQVADEILGRYRGKGLPLQVLTTSAANRDVMTGRVKPRASVGAVRTKKGVAQAKTGSAGPPPQFITPVVTETINDARPHKGETEWAFLDRHAKNLGVLMYVSHEGNLIFTTPDYSQPTIYEFRRRWQSDPAAPNNIMSGGMARDTDNSCTAVHVYGHTEGRGEFKEQVEVSVTVVNAAGQRVLASNAKASKGAPAYGKAATQRFWPREKTLRDSHAQSTTTATRLAQRELAQANANYQTFEYHLADHEQNGALYCHDTMARLVDDVAGFEGPVYLTGVSLSKGARGDRDVTMTTIQAVPSGAIVL